MCSIKKKKNYWAETAVGAQVTQDDVSVSAVSLRGQHVPVAVLPHPDQVPGHGQHAVWADPSSLPQADRKDHEEGVWGQSGPTRQKAQITDGRYDNAEDHLAGDRVSHQPHLDWTVGSALVAQNTSFNKTIKRSSVDGVGNRPMCTEEHTVLVSDAVE